MGFWSNPKFIIVLGLLAFFVMGTVLSSDAQVKQSEKGRYEIIKPSKKLEAEPEKKYDPGKLQQIQPPLFYQNLPETLRIGEFTLYVEEYTDKGKWNFAKKQAEGVSGIAWISFDCGGLFLIPIKPLIPILPEGHSLIERTFEVVLSETNPEKQISLRKAQLIQPSARVGQKMEIDLAVREVSSRSIVAAKDSLIEKMRLRDDLFIDKLKPKKKKGEVLVHFDNVTITETAPQKKQIGLGRLERLKPMKIIPVKQEGVGYIIAGTAAYPTDPPDPEIIKLFVSGFTALIDELTITPKGATANIVLQLSSNIASLGGCEPATVFLGKAAITPDCEFYVEKPGEAFGEWIVGETGMIVSGTGYIADFSSSKSPLSKAATWKGLVLQNGAASGSMNLLHSNTGYLAGEYSFTNATVINTGFAGQLSLTTALTFQPIHPDGYSVSIQKATLDVSGSAITSGSLGPGTAVLPTIAICKSGNPGDKLQVSFSTLTVQSDLDIAGAVSFGSGATIGWGELTHVGAEVVPWTLEVKTAVLYLPAGPMPTFSPDTGAGFLSFFLHSSLNTAVADMESMGMAGIALGSEHISDIAIYSRDRPSGTANPIRMQNVSGWLHIGSRGLDGELNVYEWNIKEELGDKTLYGYVGGEPFDAALNPSQKERRMLFQYATSAVYDSDITGSIDIPDPCGIDSLEFAGMEATSTANLVGGDIVLPVGGVKLKYWDLALVPTGDPTQAGVVSVRTGRLVFTAAGISEPVHFTQPFKLIWGEMLADGNLGELFFDYNSYGQRFDKQKFSPYHIVLSRYISGEASPSEKAYLAVCGTVHFNFFGSAFVNVKDAYYSSSSDPYKNRYVTVPDTGEASCDPTDLHLKGTWSDVLGDDLLTFDFPDANMDYNETIQEGFIGTGSSSVSFIHSNGLEATIEIHTDAIDICLKASETHDVDFGLFASLGGISEVYGCIRIEGPTFQRITIGGYLEHSTSAGFGILAPKTGYLTTVNFSLTPNSCQFYASGTLALAVAGTAVDVYGSVYLGVDFTKASAEGDVQGRINCNSVMSGLEGEGQVTWYVDPTTQGIQGRVSIQVCSWTGGGGLEGGIFIGHNFPKSKAWVLQSASGRFGISDTLLPDNLTGLYGYGQVSFSINLYVFGGGIEIYVGAGAFSEVPSGVSAAWEMTGIGLPYVLGSAGVYVHGEILGGLVSASAWGNLTLRGPIPVYFEGKFGLEGCVLWVFCGSVEITAGISPNDGYYMY